MEVVQAPSAWPTSLTVNTDALLPVQRCSSPFALPYSSGALQFSTQGLDTNLATERLLEAAAQGDTAGVLLSVGDGADPNAVDALGRTALSALLSSRNPSLQLLELLINAGTNLAIADARGRCPLYYASLQGSLGAVQILLRHGAMFWPLPTPASSADQQHGEAASLGAPLAHALSPAPEDQAPGSDSDAQFLALRGSCPVCVAAADANWPVVAALLKALPADWRNIQQALSALKFALWALASHRAFPRDVVNAFPKRLPQHVLDAVRPAYLASTPLVLAAGNGQTELVRWLLARGADADLGAPLLLCLERSTSADAWGSAGAAAPAGALGASGSGPASSSCAARGCMRCLLRAGATPVVAWADQPEETALVIATRNNAFAAVYQLAAHGAASQAEARRVRHALLAPPAWETHLDTLLASHGHIITQADIDSCPCGVQHTDLPPLPALTAEPPTTAPTVGASGTVEPGTDNNLAALAALNVQDPAEGEDSSFGPAGRRDWEGNADDRADDDLEHHLEWRASFLLEPHQEAACVKAVSELWRHAEARGTAGLAAAAAAAATATAAPAGPTAAALAAAGMGVSFEVCAPESYCVSPREAMAALVAESVAGTWLVAAQRCRQQRLMRAELFDMAIAAGRRRLAARRLLALRVLTGCCCGTKRTRSQAQMDHDDSTGDNDALHQQPLPRRLSGLAAGTLVRVASRVSLTIPAVAAQDPSSPPGSAPIPSPSLRKALTRLPSGAYKQEGNSSSMAMALDDIDITLSQQMMVPAVEKASGQQQQELCALPTELVHVVMVQAGLAPHGQAFPYAEQHKQQQL